MLGSSGRVVSKPRGSGYAVGIWLEDDGDDVLQVQAFDRTGIDIEKGLASAAITKQWDIWLYSGDDQAKAQVNCQPQTVLILPKLSFESVNCSVIDRDYLRRSGAVSIDIRDGTPILKHSRDAARNRPWRY